MTSGWSLLLGRFRAPFVFLMLYDSAMTYERFFIFAIALFLGVDLYAWSVNELSPFMIALSSSTIALTLFAWFAGSHRA
jgi:hypothetical protein